MRLVLTDGINEFNGVEQRHVDGLSLFTCPGCKVRNKCNKTIYGYWMDGLTKTLLVKDRFLDFFHK